MGINETVINRFQIPEEASNLLDFFFTEEDLEFISSFPDRPIAESEIDENETGCCKDLFKRGLIQKTDESGSGYILNSFYGMLDVFVVSDPKRYKSLPKETRDSIDNWYFRSYADGLDQDFSRRPTADRILSLEEMLDFIDSCPEDLYLSNCDCKSLKGDCGLPVRTCINYAPGINSFAARGISQRIGHEEAKEVIRMADEAGLVHTVSDHGICNCCDDCCYLFRTQRERKSIGYWPKASWIISHDNEKCISCGKCVGRCRFKALTLKRDDGKPRLDVDLKLCEGCGLCRRACPVEALSLRERPEEFIQINGEWK